MSYGICAVSTLSRLENGVQKPSLKVQEALLERLGCSTENQKKYQGVLTYMRGTKTRAAGNKK